MKKPFFLISWRFWVLYLIAVWVESGVVYILGAQDSWLRFPFFLTGGVLVGLLEDKWWKRDMEVTR